jgi:hypothetical protein
MAGTSLDKPGHDAISVEVAQDRRLCTDGLAMDMREQILSWLGRRRERTRRIAAEAGMLVRELGAEAYTEARLMQRKARSADEKAYWRDVAMAVARITRKRVGLDSAPAIDADFDGGGEKGTREHEPRKVDPIDDLKRIVGDQGTSHRPGTPANSARRKRAERR